MEAKLDQKLAEASLRRAALAARADTTCFRAVNAEADGLDAVTVDLFGDVAVVSLYQPFSDAEEQGLVEAVGRSLNARSVYLKRRPREARVVATTKKDELAPEPPAWGVPVPQLEVLEEGLTFLIRPGQGLSVGLYLDMRSTRAWVRGQVRGKTVLNCFAYTCAFGVAATAGGAQRSVNIDLSKKALEWGKENARKNGQAVDPQDYLHGDVFDWLARLAKRQQTFDVVILDPPSFAKGMHGTFSAGKDYASLAELAAQVTMPGGLLVACCNLAKLTPEQFLRSMEQGLHQAGKSASSMKPLGGASVDFPVPPGEPAPLKVLACFLRGSADGKTR